MMLVARENGSAVFNLLVALPLLFACGAFAFDLASFYSQGDKLQGEADRFSSHFAHSLPDSRGIRSGLDSAIQQLQLNRPKLSGSYNVSSHSVEVTLSERLPGMFTALLGTVYDDQPFATSRTATASLQPIDLVLILPDNETLRPRFKSGPGKEGSTPAPAWGDELQWPASRYLTRKSALSGRASTQGQTLSINSADHRWLTQGCFNPTLSELKHAAENLIDVVSGSTANRMAMAFTPGGEEGILVAKNLKGINGGFRDQDGNLEAVWHNYFDPISGIDDFTCLLYSDPQLNLSSAYELRTPRFHNAPEVIGTNAASGPDIPFPFAPHQDPITKVTLREYVHYHVARLSTPNFSAQTNLMASINWSLSEFDAPEDYPAAKLKRGNLAFHPKRHLLIVSDDVADSQIKELVPFLSELKKRSVSFTLILLNHHYLDPSQATRLDKAYYVGLDTFRDTGHQIILSTELSSAFQTAYRSMVQVVLRR